MHSSHRLRVIACHPFVGSHVVLLRPRARSDFAWQLMEASNVYNLEIVKVSAHTFRILELCPVTVSLVLVKPVFDVGPSRGRLVNG